MNDKKFKVEFYPSVTSAIPFVMFAETEQEAKTIFLAVSFYDIFLDDNGYRNIDANSGTAYELVAGEWIEIDEGE